MSALPNVECANCAAKRIKMTPPPSFLSVARAAFPGSSACLLTFYRTHDLTIVTVLVGPEKKPFYVYKEILCFYSKYFQNAFDGSFREADDRELVLDDIDVQTFRHVAQWLQNRGNIDETNAEAVVESLQMATSSVNRIPTSQGPNSNERSESALPGLQYTFDSADVLLNLYVFADRYDIRHLRNDVMDVWRRDEINMELFGGTELPSHVFLRAIQSTPSRSKLYQYLLKRYAMSFNWHTAAGRAYLRGIWDQLPSEFTLEFFCEQSRAVKASKRPLYKDFYGWCFYHEHEGKDESTICATRIAKLRATVESKT